jgi:protein O-mannosyl-transferase
MLSIVLATVAVYAQVAWFGFTNFDDPAYVTENVHVQSGLTAANLRWAFGLDRTTGNWHPLTWISLMMDASLFHASAAGCHVVNLALHVASSLLLFAILAGTTGQLWPAGFVAALFALHPQHVESVAWISERKDVLSTLFLMLTLLAYVRYARRPKAARYAVVLAAFALGLMAKPMLVTVPLLLLLLDWWPLQRLAPGSSGAGRFPQRRIGSLLLEKLPLAVLAAGSCAVTKMAQSSGGTVASSDVIPLGSRAMNVVMSYGIYAAKAIWPSGLACYYPHPGTWPLWETASVLVALLAVTIVVLRGARRSRYLAVGWLWYGVSLVPVIGLVQVGLQARADRYTYIPLIGIFVIAAYGMADLLGGRRSGRGLARAVPVAAVAVLAALGFVSHRQAGYWRDSVSLHSRALAVTENNWFAHNGLGFALRQEAERLADSGDQAGALEKYRDAVRQLRETTRILPQFADAHNNLATCLSALGNPEGALAELRQTLAIAPGHSRAQNNLANLLLRQGRPDEALDHYRQAIQLEPGLAGTHFNLAIALTSLHRLDEAENEYRTVLTLVAEPYYGYWARSNLALLVQRRGQTAEAVRLLEQAVRLNEVTGIDAASQTARTNLDLLQKRP